MKKLFLVVSFFLVQHIHSLETLKELAASPEVQKFMKEVATTSIIYISAKLGWKEFKKGSLLPGQKKKEKNSEKVKRKLHKEVVNMQKDVALNHKLLLYLLSVCSEVERAEFEALLSDDEKKVLGFVS